VLPFRSNRYSRVALVVDRLPGVRNTIAFSMGGHRMTNRCRHVEDVRVACVDTKAGLEDQSQRAFRSSGVAF
jgi:hypothetical protein